MTILLTILAALSATLHIRAEYAGPVYQIYVFKPLTMLLIILIALLVRRTVSRRYRALVIAGLLFSLGGDIFLMLPVDMFIAGLVSFLIGHLFYIAAFSTGSWRPSSWWSPLPFLLYAVAILSFLWPHLGQMTIPVILYVTIIMTMAWRAWERWSRMRHQAALLALVGAVLFVASDSVLAVNKFSTPFEAARLLTLVPYFTAQWFIAVSTAEDTAALFRRR